VKRRFGADVVLAVVLPVACALALLLLHPDRGQPHGAAAVEAPLTSSSLVCPGALPGSGTDLVGVSTLGSEPGSTETTVSGDVQVGLGATLAPLEVRSLRVSGASPGPGAAVVTGSDALAPGLVAGRSRSTPLAAVDCSPPATDQWFTGAGAGATHDSVIELVNPHAGDAIVDITVRSPGGVIDVPALRGVSVPGNATVRLDLGTITPNRAELSLEVQTGRGRVAVHVVDSYDELGTGAASQDWLPPQAEPALSNVLLGLAPGDGQRTLVLANAGADEVRATVQVITPTSTFAPTGVDPVRVAPGSTEAISLDDVLAQAAKDGAIGLLVGSSGPVTASLRQLVGSDLSLLAGVPAVDAATAVVVPAGQKQLLVVPSAAGTATATSYSGKGKQLDTQQVTLTPGGGAQVTLPADATLVTLTPDQTPVRAAVLLTGTGTAVVPMRELTVTGLVPDVRPGVP
jgi:hypothetical protein